MAQQMNILSVGMHQNFNKRPEPMAMHYTPAQRNPNMKVFEDKHIELYDCDKKQYVFVYLKDIILDFLGSGFTQLKDEILDKISKLPKSQIDKFIDDPAYFLIWLKDQVKLKIQYEYLSQHGNSYGSIDQRPSYYDVAERRRSLRNEGIGEIDQRPQSNMLAFNERNSYEAIELANQSMNIRPEDVDFEYLQGFREVKGVHRAFYMEAIDNSREEYGLLTEANPTLMPISVPNIGSDGRTYRVYLDNIRFRVNQPATMDAYAIIDFPASEQRIVFEALDVPFTPFGLVSNPLKIQLTNDIFVRLNNVARLKLLAGPNTFVAFNCSGFAGLGIAADVELCRSVVIPYNVANDSILPEPHRVSGHFEVSAPNFGELMVSFSMDPFVIAGVEA
jgi:hypothetical protein